MVGFKYYFSVDEKICRARLRGHGSMVGFKCYFSVDDNVVEVKYYFFVDEKIICHARAGGQPSIKIIQCPGRATEDCFA